MAISDIECQQDSYVAPLLVMSFVMFFNMPLGVGYQLGETWYQRSTRAYSEPDGLYSEPFRKQTQTLIAAKIG